MYDISKYFAYAGLSANTIGCDIVNLSMAFHGDIFDPVAVNTVTASFPSEIEAIFLEVPD
jgi:hypothetical protein